MPKRKITVPITGKVLKWAREQLNLSLQDLAYKLKVAPEEIERWEREEAFPSLTQLRNLAQILKKPTAFFLLPEPPKSKPLPTDFRTPPQVIRRGEFSPETLHSIRLAQDLQEIAVELLKDLGGSPLALPQTTFEQDPEEVAQRERKRLGVSIEEQIKLKDFGEALRYWRELLEKQGIIIFQLSLEEKECRGFALWNELAPLIVVSNKDVEQARIFTIFHEYAHLLLRESAICNLEEEFDIPDLEEMRETGEKERWASRFAAAFLVPSEDLICFLKTEFGWKGEQREWKIEQIQKIQSRYKVSRKATILRLIEIKAASWELYKRFARESQVAPEEERPREEKKIKIPLVKRKLSERGYRFCDLVFEAYERGIIEYRDLLNILDLKSSYITKLKEEIRMRKTRK